MMPAGLKDRGNLHSLGRIPAPGSSDPGLSKGQQPANNTTVIPISAKLGPNGSLMRVLKRGEYPVSVFRTREGEALVSCHFPRNWILDPCLAEAKPTIEIVGREGLAIKCEFLGIRVDAESTHCLIIRFRPREAYVLNTDTGSRGIWSAVAGVDVHTGNGVIRLMNRGHKPDTDLYEAPEESKKGA